MIGLIGINHKTASIDERAAFALSSSEAVMLIEDWKAAGYVEGAIVLSTCNRVEIYYESQSNCPASADRLIESLLDNLEVSPRLHSKMFSLRGEAMARHLFRLASGLESMVIGETQILGQVKDAFRLATSENQSTPLLSRLFHRAFEAAKRIRSQYLISATPLSAGSAAVDFVLSQAKHILDAPILIVGAGQMAETIVAHLLHLGARQVGIYNRTRDRAERFLERHPELRIHCEGDLGTALLEAEAIFVATSASNPIILPEHLHGRKAAQWLFDLAVPRNISEQVGTLPLTHLYTIDDLRTEEMQEHTAKLISEAEVILEEVLADFVQWTQGSKLREVIALIQQSSDAILERELANLPNTLTESERTLISQYDQHLRTTYATSIIAALREIAEPTGQTKHLEAMRAVFQHVLNKETR